MTYETFLTEVRDRIQWKLGEKALVRLHTVYKNNNIKMEAVCIFQEGSQVSPTIYLPPYYQRMLEGVSLEQICQEICQQYETQRCRVPLEVEEFHQLDKMKDYIAYKLIHYERNRELLKTVPHRRFLDLAVVYYLLIDHPYIGSGTVLIHQEQCQAWEVDEEQLYQWAAQNTRRRLGNELISFRQTILSLLQKDMKHQLLQESGQESCSEEQIQIWSHEILESMLPEEDGSMYILSNRGQYWGAAALLHQEKLLALAQREQCGIYVIPSSVHEVILVLDRAGSKREDLYRIHQEVCEEMVDEMEFLSDKIYYFEEGKGLYLL